MFVCLRLFDYFQKNKKYSVSCDPVRHFCDIPLYGYVDFLFIFLLCTKLTLALHPWLQRDSVQFHIETSAGSDVCTVVHLSRRIKKKNF